MEVITWTIGIALYILFLVYTINVRSREKKKKEKLRAINEQVDALMEQADKLTMEIGLLDGMGASRQAMQEVADEREEVIAQALWVLLRREDLSPSFRTYAMKKIENAPNMGLLPHDDMKKGKEQSP